MKITDKIYEGVVNYDRAFKPGKNYSRNSRLSGQNLSGVGMGTTSGLAVQAVNALIPTGPSREAIAYDRHQKDIHNSNLKILQSKF